MTTEVLILLFLALITTIIYYLIPKKYQSKLLLLSSIVFYLLLSIKASIFILLSSLSIYFGGILLDKKNDTENLTKDEQNQLKKQKKSILILVLFLNIIILLILKYGNFFLSGVTNLLHIKSITLNLILPLGISYYTLSAISYIVDVYYKKYPANKKYDQVLLFLIYFPHITMGPVARYGYLKDQLFRSVDYDFENIKHGTTNILIGLFKKMVISDRIAILVNAALATSLGGIWVFIIALLYTIQIYAEFSGYISIVRGISYLFGIKLQENFNAPFFSKTITEFWQRWHITLGAWLKDYIFYPVSLSKLNMKLNLKVKKVLKGNLGKFIVAAFPTFFVWFINGFWHGASTKYISYGLYYYLIMMIAILFQPFTNKLVQIFKINKEKNWFKVFQIVRTTIIVIFGMLLFRSSTVSEFFSLITNMFNISSFNILSFGLTKIDLLIIIIFVVVSYIFGYFKNKKIDLYEVLNKQNILIKYVFYLIIVLSIVVFGIYGPGYNVSDFVYGTF